MSLKHAILGFLNNSPKTGYDLQKKNEQTLRHFWPSTQSQVYRTLKELEDAGLIEGEVAIQRDKPNKRLYSLTSPGKDELERWLSSPLPPATHRNQFLVQLFFSRRLPREAIGANLRHYREGLKAKLEYLRSDEVERKLALAVSPKENELFRLIVENGVRLLECEMGWADDAIRRMNDLPEKCGKD